MFMRLWINCSYRHENAEEIPISNGFNYLKKAIAEHNQYFWTSSRTISFLEKNRKNKNA